MLELCSGYESALRTTVAMQRHLERIRCSDRVSAEAVLLLGEISRQIHDLTERCSSLSERVRAAATDLEAIRGGIG